MVSGSLVIACAIQSFSLMRVLGVQAPLAPGPATVQSGLSNASALLPQRHVNQRRQILGLLSRSLPALGGSQAAVCARMPRSTTAE